MARALVTLPKVAKAGEVIEITLIQRDGDRLSPRQRRRHAARAASSAASPATSPPAAVRPGDLVFATTLHAAMAANLAGFNSRQQHQQFHLCLGRRRWLRASRAGAAAGQCVRLCC